MQADRLDALARRLSEAGQRQTRSLAERLAAVDRLRETLSYKATLSRGYAVVRDGGGRVLTTQAAARDAQGIAIEFTDGTLKIGGTGTSNARAGKPAKPRASDPEGSDQGSLF